MSLILRVIYFFIFLCGAQAVQAQSMRAQRESDFTFADTQKECVQKVVEARLESEITLLTQKKKELLALDTLESEVAALEIENKILPLVGSLGKLQLKKRLNNWWDSRQEWIFSYRDKHSVVHKGLVKVEIERQWSVGLRHQTKILEPIEDLTLEDYPQDYFSRESAPALDTRSWARLGTQLFMPVEVELTYLCRLPLPSDWAKNELLFLFSLQYENAQKQLTRWDLLNFGLAEEAAPFFNED